MVNTHKRKLQASAEEQLTEKENLPTPSATNDSEANYVSARKQRRRKIADCGTTDKSRGTVRESNGYLEWLYPETNEWLRAVYHKDIRATLQHEASSNDLFGYDEPRDHGHDAHDITAYHYDQRHWRKDRRHWNSITDGVMYMMFRKAYKGRHDDQPVQGWFWHGLVVLDHDRHQMRRLDSLPVTLSSATKGWLFTALMRLDKRVRREDLWARLPPSYVKDGKRRPIFGLTEIGNIINRDFHHVEGLPSWNNRRTDFAKQRYLINRFSPEDQENNTTENGHPLSKDEMREFNAIGKGTHLLNSRYPEGHENRGKSLKETKTSIGKERCQNSAHAPGLPSTHPSPSTSFSGYDTKRQNERGYYTSYVIPFNRPTFGHQARYGQGQQIHDQRSPGYQHCEESTEQPHDLYASKPGLYGISDQANFRYSPASSVGGPSYPSYHTDAICEQKGDTHDYYWGPTSPVPIDDSGPFIHQPRVPKDDFRSKTVQPVHVRDDQWPTQDRSTPPLETRSDEPEIILPTTDFNRVCTQLFTDTLGPPIPQPQNWARPQPTSKLPGGVTLHSFERFPDLQQQNESFSQPSGGTDKDDDSITQSLYTEGHVGQDNESFTSALKRYGRKTADLQDLNAKTAENGSAPASTQLRSRATANKKRARYETEENGALKVSMPALKRQRIDGANRVGKVAVAAHTERNIEASPNRRASTPDGGHLPAYPSEWCETAIADDVGGREPTSTSPGSGSAPPLSDGSGPQEQDTHSPTPGEPRDQDLKPPSDKDFEETNSYMYDLFPSLLASGQFRDPFDPLFDEGSE